MSIRKLPLLILTIVFVGTTFSCEKDSRYADLILLNGNVYTFSWPDPDRDVILPAGLHSKTVVGMRTLKLLQ